MLRGFRGFGGLRGFHGRCGLPGSRHRALDSGTGRCLGPPRRRFLSGYPGNAELDGPSSAPPSPWAVWLRPGDRAGTGMGPGAERGCPDNGEQSSPPSHRGKGIIPEICKNGCLAPAGEPLLWPLPLSLPLQSVGQLFAPSSARSIHAEPIPAGCSCPLLPLEPGLSPPEATSHIRGIPSRMLGHQQKHPSRDVVPPWPHPALR